MGSRVVEYVPIRALGRVAARAALGLHLAAATFAAPIPFDDAASPGSAPQQDSRSDPG